MRLIPDLAAARFAPRRYRPGGIGNWSGHLPFAYGLVAALRPAVIVELGVHYGESYFGFCQSVDENAVPAVCYAVDTWTGEWQAGFYGENVFQDVESHNRLYYAPFSQLLRCTFDEALPRFADGTIDLLHIDGLHTYEAVAHDFHAWLPKVKAGGVVLLHDIVVRSPEFDVWKLWEEIAPRFPSFEFHHSLGLGVIRIGEAPLPEEPLLRLLFDSYREAEQLRRYYALLADVLEYRARLQEQRFHTSDAVCVKVYGCGPAGYEERTSVSTPIETGRWRRLTLGLPGGSGHGPVRLDPCETPAVVDLAEIQIRRASDGAVLWRCDSASGFDGLQPSRDLAILDRGETLHCFSHGFDAQMTLPPLANAAPGDALLVDLWINVEKELSRLIPVLEGSPAEPSAPEASLRERVEALARDNAALRADLERVRREQETLASEVRALALQNDRTDEPPDIAPA
ncbi:MAG: class I SAM-dependent methyltransferase [Bryobacteraceae bacterium]|nr:class I SAM-dependent methyltransferase [Bryobacteraceae bacterium]